MYLVLQEKAKHSSKCHHTFFKLYCLLLYASLKLLDLTEDQYMVNFNLNRFYRNSPEKMVNKPKDFKNL